MRRANSTIRSCAPKSRLFDVDASRLPRRWASASWTMLKTGRAHPASVEHDEICRDRAQQAPARAGDGSAAERSARMGQRRTKGGARARVPGCAPRPIRSRAGRAKSCSTSSPSGSWICRGRNNQPVSPAKGRAAMGEGRSLTRRSTIPAFAGMTKEQGQNMPLYHNDDQAMLKDACAALRGRSRHRVAYAQASRQRNDATGFSRELCGTVRRDGPARHAVPEAHGGLGIGHMEAGVVLEEIGRNLSPSPFLSTSVGAVPRTRRRAGTAGGALVPRRCIAGETDRCARDRRGRANTAPTASHDHRDAFGQRLPPRRHQAASCSTAMSPTC
jgi:hypothetical protein